MKMNLSSYIKNILLHILQNIYFLSPKHTHIREEEILFLLLNLKLNNFLLIPFTIDMNLNKYNDRKKSSRKD